MSLQRSILAVILALLPATQARAEDPLRIGERVGKLKFVDIRYLPRTLDDLGAKKASVLVFTNTSCPQANRYFPTLKSLAMEYRDKDVQFVAVNSAEEDSVVDMAAQAVRLDVEFPFVKDFGAVCAHTLGVRRTPEVVVIDANKRLRYRGRIDDQYRLGGPRPAPTRRDLKEALDAVLAGRMVTSTETEVDGCPITFPKPEKSREVTYAAHVAPILEKHCWECHRAGGSAPFSLTGYKAASARAEAVAEVVTEQRMPPWFAQHTFGPFTNRRGLSDEERETVARWARSGAAAGDLSKAPAAPKEPESKWRIAAPDLVIQSRELELPAAGDIPYTYVLLPHIFTEETWIEAAEIVSDNPTVLHHANLAFANLTEGIKESNFVTGNVPGGEPMTFGEGTAFCIPKGSVLGLQIHFVTTGKPEKCRVSVGLRYPRGIVQRRLRNIQLTDHRFAIPPGAPAHKVAASRILDCDAVGVGLFSHMHLRGKDMTFTAHLPGGNSETLLMIPNYSFSWQLPYRWEPGKKQLPKGTRLECVAHYDNSPFNPYNPDPKATVRNGPQTHNEMMYGFFFYTDAAEKLALRIDPKTGTVLKKEEKR
jgi:thiol-disulfide isomerase/thioredoxin/mono/diheme cytochrome c family protein